MIRVAIFADTLLRAQNFANSLADDERLEIVETRVLSRSLRLPRIPMADVIVAVGVKLAESLDSGLGPIVLVTNEAPRRSLAGAVHALLPEDASPADIAAAIFAAAQDLTVLTQTQVRLWLQRQDAMHEEGPPPVESLTGREREVLRRMADGLANKEIAVQLGISEHTAKFHVAQILAKLGAASRAEAVTIGIRRGLVPI